MDDKVARLAQRVERLEAELALHRLAHDYCIGADHHDVESWLGAWTHDAVWQVSDDRAFTGRDEILAAVRQQWNHFLQMQHGTVNHTVELDPDEPDRATGRADVVLHVQLQDTRWVTGGGTYRDEYRRQDGHWRIARRTVVRPFDLAPLETSAGPITADEDDDNASGIGRASPD